MNHHIMGHTLLGFLPEPTDRTDIFPKHIDDCQSLYRQ